MIRIIYHEEPKFPATDQHPSAVRYHIGEFWIDAVGAEPTAADLTAINRLALVRKIDSDADAIYSAVIGNRSTEYAQAEIDGINYKAANYTGTVPSSVLSWATAKGWTATKACDDILQTAAGWRTAQAAIRAQRLGKKEEAKNAVDEAALILVSAQWSLFVSAVRAQLGLS
jgi:hypothetical protein